MARVRPLTKIAKIILLVICVLVTAAAIIGMHQKYDELLNAFPYIHPVEGTVLLISITGILSSVFHIYSLLFLIKQPKLVKLKISFSVPNIIKHSTALFAIALLSLEVQGYINNAFNFRKIDTETTMSLLIILTIALWHLFDLYYFTKRLKLHNALVNIEISDIGKE